MKKRKDDIVLKLKALNRLNDAVLKGRKAIVHVPEQRIVNGRPRAVSKRIVVDLPKRRLDLRFTHNEFMDVPQPEPTTKDYNDKGFCDVPKTVT